MNRNGYYIKFKSKETKIKSIADFTISEYDELQVILGLSNAEEQILKLWQLFTTLSVDEIFEVDDLNAIDFKELINEPLYTSVRTLRFRKKKLVDLFENISLGRFIDLEFFVSGTTSLLDAAALCILGNDYEIEDFNEAKTFIGKLPLGQVLTIFESYIAFRKNIYESYSALFSSDGDSDDVDSNDGDIEVSPDHEDDIEFTDDDSEQIGFGMISIVYSLSNGDITKHDIILKKDLYSVLNFLAWQKEQSDKAESENKRKQNLIK